MRALIMNTYHRVMLLLALVATWAGISYHIWG